MSDDREGVLARWSKRKHAARQAVRSGSVPVQDEAPSVAEARAPGDGSAELNRTGQTEFQRAPGPKPIDERPPLTPIEELGADSDYTQFLSREVPESIKRAALRKLWGSDPIFAEIDGLDHYCEDYNLTSIPISAAETAYRPGLGYREEVQADDVAEEQRPAGADQTPRVSEVTTADSVTAAEAEPRHDDAAALEDATAALEEPSDPDRDSDNISRP